MREISFRGKQVGKDEWVYGYFVKYEPSNECFIHDGYSYERLTEVTLDSIGQYTGLKDKNGVEIFEGDLLDCVDRIVEVYWNEKCGTWDSQFIKYTDIEQMSNGIEVVNWKYRATVIGNIHEVTL